MNTKIRTIAAVLALLLVSAAVAPTAATALDGRQQTYAGTHVAFDASGNAVTDYAVDGETLVSSVKMESKSQYESRTGVSLDLDLSTVTNLQGSALSVDAKTNAQATVTAESGATMTAHDNTHGILVVTSGGESQLVKADVASSSTAEANGDNRVVVTTGDGAKGTFIVVGDGSVDVNSEGDVVANVDSGGKLVFRAYDDGNRDASAKTTETLIANGTAAGEVYVMAEEDGETVTDTVNYSRDTTIEATQSAENEVQVTVDRASHDGKVIITQVSESAVGAADSLTVAVDGEAAVKASSYSEVVAASNGGNTSKYVVRQPSQMKAQGNAAVLVGVNHFSTRTITMSGADGGDTATDDGGTETDSDDSDGEDSESDESDGNSTPTTSSSTPGFGLAVALVALVAAGLLAVRRS